MPHECQQCNFGKVKMVEMTLKHASLIYNETFREILEVLRKIFCSDIKTENYSLTGGFL